MQNEKNINNKSNQIHQLLFCVFFCFPFSISLFVSPSLSFSCVQIIFSSVRNEIVHLRRIHSVAVAITNWILFPFYKSQFCFYVFVSSVHLHNSGGRFFLPTVYWIHKESKAQHSVWIYMTLGRNISHWYLLMLCSHLALPCHTHTHLYMLARSHTIYIVTIKLRLFFAVHILQPPMAIRMW